jgi:hypothetical protein
LLPPRLVQNVIKLHLCLWGALLGAEHIHQAWRALELQLVEAVFRIDHRKNVLNVFSKALVDLDLLLELFDNDSVLLLKLLVFFALFLELVFRDGLGPVKLGLLGSQLHVQPVELLDLLLLVDAFLAQLDSRLLGHTHVVHNVLATAAFLDQLRIVLSHKRVLTGNFLLLLFDAFSLDLDEVSEFLHFLTLILEALLNKGDALHGVLLL